MSTVRKFIKLFQALSFDVALDINRFRKLVKERIKNEKKCLEFIKEYLYCTADVAENIYNYIKEQHDFSEVPTEK